LISQYEITFGSEHEEAVRTINYGVLERVLECKLGEEKIWGAQRGTTHLLAVITPWRTEGEDASQEVVTFKRTLAQIVTDLRNIRGVVGRIESRGTWGVVDRNVNLVRATFANNEGHMSDSESDN
jgi:hypothetical protein